MSNNIKPLDKLFNNSIKFLLLAWFVLSSTLAYFQVPAQFHTVATDILMAFVIIFCAIVIPFVIIKRFVLNFLRQKTAKMGVLELTDLGFALPDSIYINKNKTKINLTLYHTLYTSYEKYLFTSQFSDVLTKLPDDNFDDSPIDLEPNTAKTPKELFEEAKSGANQAGGDEVTTNEDLDDESLDDESGEYDLPNDDAQPSEDVVDYEAGVPQEGNDSVVVADETEVEK